MSTESRVQGLSDAVVSALCKGEVITLFADRGTYTEGDEIDVVSVGPTDVNALKPAYKRTATHDLSHVAASATVHAVHPAGLLDPEAGASRHIFDQVGTGDLVLVRVAIDGVPVLSDSAFAARRKSVEGALGG